MKTFTYKEIVEEIELSRMKLLRKHNKEGLNDEEVKEITKLTDLQKAIKVTNEK